MKRLANSTKTVQPNFLGDRIYHILKMEILRGDQPAGADIREGELAQRLGTSKTPVREAPSAITMTQPVSASAW
jgi:DNA-binding GntR family transcriptional regulator